MNVARILYPVETLGPGKRIGIWLCGCHRACSGCSNPELWEKREEYEINCDTLAQLIYKIANQHEVDGFTITGGEPMNQAEALQSLLPELRKINPDILVYSGYTLEELRGLKSTAVETVLRQIAVLIGAAYIEERNTDALLNEDRIIRKYGSWTNSSAADMRRIWKRHIIKFRILQDGMALFPSEFINQDS